MHKVRRLTEEGRARFAAFLANLRDNGKAPTPLSLLEDDMTSEPLGCNAWIEDAPFESRFELGKYLLAQFESCDRQRIANDNGLWDWLALYYFDQLCPADSSGTRKPSEDAHYILSDDYGKRPRHAIRTTYLLIETYGDTVRCMFSKLEKRGELAEQFAATQYHWGCRGVVETISDLYCDPDRGGFKSGTAGKGRGSTRRLKTFLSQVTLTYDLYTLSKDDLLGMLPKEYDRFRPTPT